MTPKQQVLQRYPDAWAQRVEQTWYIRPTYSIAGGCFAARLAEGNNPTAAWRAAAKAVAKKGGQL